MAEVALGRYLDTWYPCERDARRDLACAAYVVGVQGMGKSTLLANLAEQFARSGEGVLVIDAKGELSDDIAARTAQFEKLIYVAPGETNYPSGVRFWTLNPLAFDRTQPHLQEAAIKNLLALFDRLELADLKRMPQLRQMLYMLAQLAMGLPEPTLGDLLRLLADAPLRRRLLANSALTEAVVAFWRRYDNLTPKQQDEKATTTLPRLNELLAAPVISRVVSAANSTMRLAEWLDDGKLVVCNLGMKFDGETSRLLGNFLVAAVINAGSARPTINEQPLMRPWRVVVDEFHQLAGDQFAEIIEQLRKHHVFPVIAHQNLSQLSDRLTAAATSCAVRFFFRVSPDDQASIKRLFGPDVSAGLTSLPQFQARAQLPHDPGVITLQACNWWAPRDERQLRAAKLAADDDRFTVLDAPSFDLSARSSTASNTSSDPDNVINNSPAPTQRKATKQPAGAKRLLDGFDDLEQEAPHEHARPLDPHPPERRPSEPMAAQAHLERDRDPERDRPYRLLDQFTD